MERGLRIAKKYFKISGDQLVVGGKSIEEITEKISTPAYLYDFDLLQENYSSLRNGLVKDISIFYSLKANPSLAVSHFYNRLGCGAEIGSLGELEVARQANFPPNRIIYAGPGKRSDELEASIKEGILAINVESLDELKEISRLAQSLDKQANVCLRINPLKNLTGSHLRMGGASTPFGIGEEMTTQALTLIRESQWLHFQGIHIYVGNQIFDHRLAILNILNTLDIAKDIAGKLGIQSLPYLNFGGGLGIPYYKNEKDFDEQSFQQELNQIIRTAQKQPLFQETSFILELGRYLVARCGIFLTKVLYTKESREHYFAVTDGGMNYCSIATGNLGQKIKRKFPLCIANRTSKPLTEKLAIVGPLCTPMDEFGKNFMAPAVEAGDTLAVFFVGAYGMSTSPQQFLSHTGCQEFAIFQGDLQQIGQTASLADHLQGQNIFRERR